jgi:molybdate transport system substrate-binding protein
MKRRSIALLMVLLVGALVGCTSNGAEKPISEQSKPVLTVGAASDLTKAFTELGKAFEEEYDCMITFSFGSTGNLAEQIINGAPFDVFAAANEKMMEELDEKGMILSDTKQLYALGRIGITTMKNSPIQVETVEALLNPEIKKIAIANPDHAPYGLAAKEALVSLGLWEELEPKFVYGKNISETLMFITTGNAEVGFIALSLNDEESLSFTLVEEQLHNPLSQAMAVIKAAKQEDLGREFIDYVLSEKGQKIMNGYGFTLPGE